jgi:hypothetical protein
LADLNAELLAGCREDEARVIAGRDQSVGSAMLIERAHLLPLAREDFDLAEVSFPTVNNIGQVKVRTNAYSAPVRTGVKVQVKVTPTTVEVWHEGKCVATHERCYGRNQEILNLEHYLDVLEHKPGALMGSKPLAQWRKLGRWPASYDQLWTSLVERHGRQKGTREMIELLQVGKIHGQEKLRAAVEQALALGCVDSAAVRYLVTANRPEGIDSTSPPLDGHSLRSEQAMALFERPLPTVSEYDRLLTGPVKAQLGVENECTHCWSTSRGGGGEVIAMSVSLAPLEQSGIREHCKLLHLPTIGAQCARLAEQAERERQGYLGYLDALLAAELEEREHNTVARRIGEAHLPKVKTLEEFDFGEMSALTGASGLGDEDPGVGRGRLHRPGGAGGVHRGLRHR